jgi:hypothetical protein
MNGIRSHVSILCISVVLAACAVPTEPAASIAGALATVDAPPGACRAVPDASQPQYVIGYGSLMQDESRKRTSPQAGPAHPVKVTGYRRGWFAKGDPLGFSTTFLGAVPEPGSELNAVIYRLEVDELLATDQREASYCRSSVPISNVQALEKGPFEVSAGQVWIYTNRPESVATPSDQYPIVQSYVDIFVSGCLEQEQRFGLKGFALQCVATTRDWSRHWVNDRLYPRRPFIYQPKARQIDSLLSRQVPQFFSQIKIQ